MNCLPRCTDKRMDARALFFRERPLGTISFVLPAILWGIILLMVPVRVCAWELTVGGAFGWEYDYYSQMGNHGFFGVFNKDNSSGSGDVLVSPGFYAPANGWLGYQSLAAPADQLPGDIVTGADGSRALFSAWFSPRLRINRALSITGSLRTGPGQLLGETPGFTTALANFEWTLLWFSAETPWGRVLFGKKPFGMGCGLQLDAGNRTDDSLMLASDLGPFRFGIGFYPWRRGSETYSNRTDKNGSTIVDFVGFADYSTPHLTAGVGGTYTKFHEGPESGLRFIDIPEPEQIPPLDVDITEGWMFLKYNNGRVFFNTEADWYYRTDRMQRSMDGTILGVEDVGDGRGSIFRPQYRESWRYMLELGFITGPSKVSLIHSFLPGPDRRHGELIDRQPYILGPAVANTDVFRPYSIILNAGYGSGAGQGSTVAPYGRDAVNYDGEGYMSDASIFGVRVDHALAANFNMYGSFLYSNRASHGYGWGFIEPTRDIVLNRRVLLAKFERKGDYASPAPAIPDNNLGWEIDAGLSWQLLDSWTLFCTAGFWQPGKWFNFACVDRSVPDWDGNPGPANNWGANPDRTIDPVLTIQTAISGEF